MKKKFNLFSPKIQYKTEKLTPLSVWAIFKEKRKKKAKCVNLNKPKHKQCEHHTLSFRRMFL
jgi:hypothetical protein